LPKIQKFFRNLTFTPSVHHSILKSDVFNILEAQNINEISIHNQISLVNLAINSKNYYNIADKDNMITSLAIISKCNEPLQMRILDSVINYVLSNEFVRKAEEEASIDYAKFH